MQRLIGFSTLALCFAATCISAQTPQADRVLARPELSVLVRLPGHLPGWASPAADAGPVPADTPLHLTFVLSRAPQQQADFEQLLADQQNPDSPRYHQWLTPQQVGELYGPTQPDIDAITAWLTANGFGSAQVTPSRMFVSFTAPSSSVSKTLATTFRYFSVSGEPRISATQDPALPSAFASVVQSVDGLSDTPIVPMVHGDSAALVPASGGSVAKPRFTPPSGLHYLSPGDFARAFDLTVPYTQNVTGIGQRIAVIGRSRVVSSDITEFEATTGLSQNVPTTVIPSVDPGYTANGDQSEATLDVSRALGTAPAAQVDLVVLPNSAGGIFAAAQYAVNTLNDAVMNISFGSCETSAGSAGVRAWDTLFSQAASQGISVFISSMDSGADGCAPAFTTPPTTQALSVNYICSSSYATCVGGTEFADTANPSQYWSSGNSSSLVSLNSYIPEGAWNEPTSGSSYQAAASGGGASIYIAKPSWQTGLGVPADGARDVPDVSYPAAMHDAYYACYAGGSGDCAANRFEYFFGTSTAAPTMAGLAAILNQRMGSRQGNLNPQLYALAANASKNVFHDVTVASSGVIGCSASTASMCNNTLPTATSLTGGLAAYLVTPGYDLVTGLGSIDAGNLLAALGSAQFPSTASVSATSLPIYTNQRDTFTATVSSTHAGTPTGFVQFFLNGITQGAAVALAANGTATSAPVTFPALGSQVITATYSGDATYAPSTQGLAETIIPPGFSITSSPSSLSFSAGATTGNTATLTYTSLGAFSGSIAQVCTITYSGGAAVDLPTCTFGNSTVTLPANSTVTSTITIMSVAPGGSGAGAAAANRLPVTHSSTLAGFTFGSLLVLLWSGRSRRPHLRALVGVLAVSTALLSASGCGKSTPAAPTGSSTGTYTIALTSFSGTTLPTPAASITLTLH